MAPRPEFPGYVRASLGAQADAGSRGTGARMQCPLRNSSGGRVTRDSAHRRCSSSGPRITRDYRARQSVPEPSFHTATSRTVIVQILVQPGGYAMLDRGLHSMSRQTRSEPLAESTRPASPFSRTVAKLGNPGARPHSSQRTFAESGTFPVLPVRVAILPDCAIYCRNRKNRRHKYNGGSHNIDSCNSPARGRSTTAAISQWQPACARRFQRIE